MTRSTSVYFAPPLVRASDAEREESLRQLRGHWIAGRLELDEYEERCGEAARARYLADLTAVVRELPAAPAVPVVVVRPPTSGQGQGVAALVLGILGLVLFVISFGSFFFISLPLSVTACALGVWTGRRARGGTAPMAIAGQVLGIVGTVMALPILLFLVT
jgi:hypothetical protein